MAPHPLERCLPDEGMRGKLDAALERMASADEAMEIVIDGETPSQKSTAITAHVYRKAQLGDKRRKRVIFVGEDHFAVECVREWLDNPNVEEGCLHAKLEKMDRFQAPEKEDTLVLLTMHVFSGVLFLMSCTNNDQEYAKVAERLLNNAIVIFDHRCNADAFHSNAAYLLFDTIMGNFQNVSVVHLIHSRVDKAKLDWIGITNAEGEDRLDVHLDAVPTTLEEHYLTQPSCWLKPSKQASEAVYLIKKYRGEGVACYLPETVAHLVCKQLHEEKVDYFSEGVHRVDRLTGKTPKVLILEDSRGSLPMRHVKHLVVSGVTEAMRFDSVLGKRVRALAWIPQGQLEQQLDSLRHSLAYAKTRDETVTATVHFLFSEQEIGRVIYAKEEDPLYIDPRLLLLRMYKMELLGKPGAHTDPDVEEELDTSHAREALRRLRGFGLVDDYLTAKGELFLRALLYDEEIAGRTFPLEVLQLTLRFRQQDNEGIMSKEEANILALMASFVRWEGGEIFCDNMLDSRLLPGWQDDAPRAKAVRDSVAAFLGDHDTSAIGRRLKEDWDTGDLWLLCAIGRVCRSGDEPWQPVVPGDDGVSVRDPTMMYNRHNLSCTLHGFVGLSDATPMGGEALEPSFIEESVWIEIHAAILEAWSHHLLLIPAASDEAPFPDGALDVSSQKWVHLDATTLSRVYRTPDADGKKGYPPQMMWAVALEYRERGGKYTASGLIEIPATTVAEFKKEMGMGLFIGLGSVIRLDRMPPTNG